MELPVNVELLLSNKVVENNRIEYKRGWNPDTVYRSICAFANDFDDVGGGYIIVGAEENNGIAVRPVRGLDINQLDMIQREMVGFDNLIQPIYHSHNYIEEVDGKKVFIIWVTSGDGRPYRVPEKITSKKKFYRYYIRYNSNSIEASGQYLTELLNLANKIPFDDRGNLTATVSDISMTLVRDFLAEANSKLLDQLGKNSFIDILRQMDLITGPKEKPLIKNVALMLFSNEPCKFFPYTQVDIVIYPMDKDENPNTFIEKESIKGPVQYIIGKTLDFLRTMVVQQKVVKISGKEEAIRVYNYPYRALDEAIVNSLYHRSYEEREPVEIAISPNKIEIINYGAVDRSIKECDLNDGKSIRARRYRNRRLGDFLKELNLTEGRGTGLPTIRKELNINRSPDAKYEIDDTYSSFIVTFKVHEAFRCNELIISEDGKIISGKPATQMTRRKEIFMLILNNASITRNELAKKIHIAPSAVQKHLAVLQKEGYIVRTGKTRASCWVVARREYKDDI
jgi:ATP-dependent DNA helicase RecG